MGARGRLARSATRTSSETRDPTLRAALARTARASPRSRVQVAILIPTTCSAPDGAGIPQCGFQLFEQEREGSLRLGGNEVRVLTLDLSRIEALQCGRVSLTRVCSHRRNHTDRNEMIVPRGAHSVERLDELMDRALAWLEKHAGRADALESGTMDTA